MLDETDIQELREMDRIEKQRRRNMWLDDRDPAKVHPPEEDDDETDDQNDDDNEDE